MKPLVYEMRQDDRRKCTAAKLARFKIAESVRSVRKNTIVLNPFAQKMLTKKDAVFADSVCAIDCSWEKAGDALAQQRVLPDGVPRKLPAMLAANPTNYAKLGKLSSAEALAGALYILGDRETAEKIMNKFKWGHTFLELNANILEDYAQAEDQETLEQLERAYFPALA